MACGLKEAIGEVLKKASAQRVELRQYECGRGVLLGCGISNMQRKFWYHLEIRSGAESSGSHSLHTDEKLVMMICLLPSRLQGHSVPARLLLAECKGVAQETLLAALWAEVTTKLHLPALYTHA